LPLFVTGKKKSGAMRVRVRERSGTGAFEYMGVKTTAGQSSLLGKHPENTHAAKRKYYPEAGEILGNPTW